jgi:hypothetical protein
MHTKEEMIILDWKDGLYFFITKEKKFVALLRKCWKRIILKYLEYINVNLL